METVHGAPSFRLSSPGVDLCVTRTGGMLAPVAFRLGGREVSPYALAPWEPDQLDAALPNLLKFLRGDFLCLPFGPQDDGDPHGETANADWSLVASSDELLHLALQPGDVGGKVEKLLTVKGGQPAIYCEHRISGVKGSYSYGTHPVLDFSGVPTGQGRVTTSPFHWGSVNPGLFSNPENKEYQILRPGAPVDDLRAVPLATGGTTDVTRYPDRRGYEDLVMIANQPATAEQPFAWSAAVLDGYLWFSLKDPAAFPCTIFWISNGGRHSDPWQGRHLARLGIEECCSHFADNVTASREDRLADHGVPTTREFSPDETTSLRIVQAAAAVPDDFGAVAAIVPDGEGAVAITSETGVETRAEVDWGFVV